MQFSLPTSALSRLSLVLISLLFLISCFFFLVRGVHAASECDRGSTPPATDPEAIDKINKCAIEKNIFDDKIFNLNQIAGTTDSLYSLLTGRSRLHPETDNITQKSGALASTGHLVAAIYSSPPISGVQYFAEEFRNLNPVQPVYAQEGTIGFDALKPVQQVWTVFRNISYIGFVLVFVIMGFMIMFRAHISPQAVATVQDSIPRIVIALILVTFSYALAGLMVDIMFLVLNIIINTLQTSGILDSGQYVFHQNVFQVVTGSWVDTVKVVANSIANLIDDVVSLPFKLDKIIAVFGGGVAGIIVGIAMLFIMFRIFLMLLMAYVMIIVLTMFAPFFFLFQALPGRNGASEWFKQMASNVAIFPTVAIMFILAGVIGGVSKLGSTTGHSLIGQGQIGQFPLLAGNLSTEAIGGLIGIGFLLLTPSAAELVKNAIGAKGPQLGGGIGASLAGGAAVVGGAARRGGGALWERGPIAERMDSGRLLRQEAAAKRAKLPTFASAHRETTEEGAASDADKGKTD